MFGSKNLRCVVLVGIAAALAAGCEKAPEAKGDGPKMEFVRIPAGSFHMGSPPSEEGRDNSEGPVHEVRITKPFYMGKYEVTQAQWKAVMGTTLSQQHDKANSPWLLKGEGAEYPMYYVSWEEAAEFCKRLGRGFRLPTEAEWEYACRAGSQTRFYYGDDPNYSEIGQYAWYYGNNNNTTHPVGQKKTNAWGLYDMYGNVGECCSDRYVILGNYEAAGSVDPTGPASAKGTLRVSRGGSWLEKPNICRSASRGGFIRGCDLVGFRVVYTGRATGAGEVLEIALPEKPSLAAAAPYKKTGSRPQAIAGVVRDEAGLPIADLQMVILPIGGWWYLRQYAEGKFEICRLRSDPNARTQGYHFVARHEKRNLAVAVEIKEDANALDVRLKPGVILTGQVVDPRGKGVEGATVVITELQTTNWSARYLGRVEADAEGKFEFKALPPGYDYGLTTRKMHYGVGQTEVRSEDVRDNRVQGISVVLPRGEFSVSGIVVDAEGKSVPNVYVYCTGRGQVGINCSTDAEGHFKADGIFAGDVDVTANIKSDDGRWLSGSVKTQAGAADVRVVLGIGGGAPPPKGRACFPADTQVWVNGQLVRISQVAELQTVAGRASTAPATPLGQVEGIEEHLGAFECRDIVFENGNRISVVGAHCFMLDCGQWVAAQDLRGGLKLKTLDGTVTIRSVTIRTMPFVGKVCNLKVENSDRYMVGKDAVIVRDW